MNRSAMMSTIAAAWSRPSTSAMLAAMLRMHERSCRQFAHSMSCQSQGSGRMRIVSIRWMRAIEIEIIGKQQPSKHRPTGDPAQQLPGSMQQHPMYPWQQTKSSMPL
eukprot:CAMPEP_0174722270 /NCGR_PEP_ID=MMETSP1094-20130205/38041_1 /TAXON_ID=156173 /ORGANISM="Chrysochromulina brevifilum, Strain UTEX LB 985" /LENGTH=106 /DNA_ID=CAMNT_0015923095 /DNA_START=592 /DNA_END=915 /DNA_ORIENTATION=-